MEERAWDLVEIFISGEASGQDVRDLQYLMEQSRNLYLSIKEFFDTYIDPNPQITDEDKRALLDGVYIDLSC